MKKHFWFGQLVDDSALEDFLERDLDWIHAPKPHFNILEVIKSLDRWSKKLTLDIDLDFKKELIKFCDAGELKKKFIKELGSIEALTLRRVDFKGNYFEKRSPLGIITHILPGNSEGLSFLAAIEALLVGNTSIVKLSSTESDLAIELCLNLIENDTSGCIQSRLAFLRLESNSKLLSRALALSHGVSAWGGDSALSSIKSLLSPQTTFIPWGHKISFALVSKGEKSKEQLEKLAHDVIDLNQQACSSPQSLFLECDSKEELKAFALKFLPFLVQAARKKGPMNLDNMERAEIQNESMIFRFMEAQGEAFFLEEEDVRILGKMKSEMSPSPLNRTLQLRPISKGNVSKVLFRWSEYLQTCGLLCNDQTEYLSWCELLLNAGVPRICLPGKMVDSYSGEPHDGQFALERFSKIVRLEMPTGENFNSLLGEPLVRPSRSRALMNKNDFQNQEDSGLAHFYFKSGGSSGTPKISRFSYQDYHSQMQAAADGLICAGLDPSSDRVINLFFGGGLYGGFLSFTTILEKLNAVQLPMGAVEDFDFITSQIIALKVNTLFGMPSYLFQYLEDQEEELNHYGGLTKIFYGGEHFSSGQRSWIRKKFSIDFIKSASYGSVDAGPIGYQCPYSTGGVHHLNHQLQTLEILDLERDQDVAGEEVGRLIVSTPSREAMVVERYDIGDLGRWVLGPCQCGSPSPRFELLGRTGDVFRAAGNFLSYKKFETILSDQGFVGEFQIILDNDGHQDRLSLVLGFSDGKKPVVDSMNIINEIKELREAVMDEGLLNFSLLYSESGVLDRVESSGKLRHVIDKREIGRI